MAPHSSTLAWKIPWTEEPDGLQSMGSQSRTRLSDFTYLMLEEWCMGSSLLYKVSISQLSISKEP